MSAVTFIAPINIPVIKYWGKRINKAMLPINDSISVTLDMEQLYTKTTIKASLDYKESKMWLNGREESMENIRVQNCIAEIKKKAKLTDEMKNWKLHIYSENNFPTAAALPSRAAEYACLATALAKLYKVKDDITSAALAGAGSAGRSLLGGFVKWEMGEDPEGSDSIVKQLLPASHWPEMRVLILVVNDLKKKASNLDDIKKTLMSSEILRYKTKIITPIRISQIQVAIKTKTFDTFAELITRDSNEMHAAAMASYPPCVYMNDTSHLIAELMHSYNGSLEDDLKVAYTFDTGPNAVLFVLEKNVLKLLSVIDYYFPPVKDSIIKYQKGISVDISPLSEDLIKKIKFTKQKPGKLKFIIHTRVGDGPKQLSNSEAVTLRHFK